MKTYLFGARATAAGMYRALKALRPDIRIDAFLVSRREGNPAAVRGCPVLPLREVSAALSGAEKREARIYVCVPELIHGEIAGLLQGEGFRNITYLDARSEADWMERYYASQGMFPSVHSLAPPPEDAETPKATMYAASFYKDRPLRSPPELPPFVKRLYLGCAAARRQGLDLTGRADFYDDEGDNISDRNPNRCEMTAHYWVWKNRLETADEYVGICHYRRLLDLSEEDLRKAAYHGADAVLPFPMVHEPNAGIQHTWYVREADWRTLRQAVRELYPAFDARFDGIFSRPWFYNYNIFLAKKQVFADYCAWLYPILDRIEACSEPPGSERGDRYTAYMSESLTTLYFMVHADDYKILHTGRLLYV